MEISREEKALELTQRGIDLVQEGRTREALAIARELHQMRFSGGFEVEAQALARDGEIEEAISVLRKGMELAPAAWLNASLLGNYLSDVGRYAEAFAAYEQALDVPAADRILIEANHAMAMQRAGKDEAARAKLQSVLAQDMSDAEPGLVRFVRKLATSLDL